MNYYEIRKQAFEEVKNMFFDGKEPREIKITIKSKYGVTDKMVEEFIDDARYIFKQSTKLIDEVKGDGTNDKKL